MYDQRHDREQRDYEPPPSDRVVRSMRLPLIIAAFVLTGSLLAAPGSVTVSV